MKKFILGLFMLLVTVLAACGGSQNAEEVYQKAVEAGEKMESAEMDMVISQTIEGDPMMGTMAMDMDVNSKVILNPLAMHQTGTINMEMQGIPIETEIEMYMTDTNFYMYESMTQTWLKMDNEFMPTELMNMEQNPQDQLQLLESFIDDIEFTEEGDIYVFKFDGEGEELAELSQELVKESLGADTFADLGVDVNEVFENMTIHSIYYEIHIDKATYDTKTVISTMDFEFNVDGESLSIQQEMNATYTGINTIEKIEVPQEVIDSAEEF